MKDSVGEICRKSKDVPSERGEIRMRHARLHARKIQGLLICRNNEVMMGSNRIHRRPQQKTKAYIRYTLLFYPVRVREILELYRTQIHKKLGSKKKIF